MTQNHSPLIGGKTIEDWDCLWVQVPSGLERHQPFLREAVGLYRYKLYDDVQALGTSSYSKGGIAKRLSDFIRPNWSGRSHHAGALIFKHRRELTVEVLITGAGRHASTIARQLKAAMTKLHRPNWNERDPGSLWTRKAKRKSRR